MRKIFYFYIIVILLVEFCSCQSYISEASCRLFVYRAYSPNKVYEISFNGKDSIETICGEVDWDNFFNPIDEKRFNSNTFQFDTIYLQKQLKLSKEYCDTLQETLRMLNSKTLVDTVPTLCKDGEYFYVALDKQDICQVDGFFKDNDLIRLCEKLIEYSPIYINRCDWHWWNLEVEELISKYCKGEVEWNAIEDKIQQELKNGIK